MNNRQYVLFEKPYSGEPILTNMSDPNFLFHTRYPRILKYIYWEYEYYLTYLGNPHWFVSDTSLTLSADKLDKRFANELACLYYDLHCIMNKEPLEWVSDTTTLTMYSMNYTGGGWEWEFPDALGRIIKLAIYPDATLLNPIII